MGELPIAHHIGYDLGGQETGRCAQKTPLRHLFYSVGEPSNNGEIGFACHWARVVVFSAVYFLRDAILLPCAKIRNGIFNARRRVSRFKRRTTSHVY